jgi:uncharacterized protein YdhG (YjbR/CyaY superfamily)
MHPARPKVATVDEYIDLFPKNTQTKLKEVRKLIKKTAPEAEELISYAIAAYKLRKKALIYFAGYEKHIGLYPLPHNIDPEFAEEIKPYVAGKGTLRFPLDRPLPLALIEKVVKHKMTEI